MAHRIPETRKGKREIGNRKWEIRNGNGKREAGSQNPESEKQNIENSRMET